MRITNKVFLMISLVAAAAFANPVCVDLCGECTSLPNDATCRKLDALCKCQSVLDSAMAKGAVVAQSKQKLVADISAGCGKTACSRNFTFEDGLYVQLKKGKTSLATAAIVNGATVAGQKSKTQKPVALRKAESMLDSLTRRRTSLTFAPMTMECSDKCNSCDARAAALLAPAPVQMSVDTTLNPAEQAPAAATAPGTAQTPAAVDAQISAAVNAQTPAALPADSSAALANQQTAAVPAAPQVALPAAQQAATDSITRADSLANVECQKTEKICMCAAYKENAAQLAILDSLIKISRARIDSLEKNAPTLVRGDMAMQIADTTHALCAGAKKCTFEVTFTSAELALLELHKVDDSEANPTTFHEIHAPNIAQSNVQGAENSTAAGNAADNAKAGPQIIAQPDDSASTAALTNACTIFYSNHKAEFDSLKKKVDSNRIFYKGAEITYGQFSEKEPMLSGNLGEMSFEGRLGYVFRWYFYDAGAVNLGLGFVYHYRRMISDEDGAHLEYKYHYGAMDVPITFRLGIPKIPYVRPYISESFVFQKPLALAYHDKIESPAKNRSVWENDLYGSGDWEYTVWLGLGMEFTRHFSLEYQMLFGSKASGDAMRYDDGETFRVAMQFMI